MCGFNARAPGGEHRRRRDLPGGPVRACTSRGVKGYVTLNTLVFTDELAGVRRGSSGTSPGAASTPCCCRTWDGPARPRDLPRPAGPRLDADDADERRVRPVSAAALGRRAGRAGPRAVGRRDRARSPSGATMPLEAVRPAALVRRLLRPVPHQRIARGPERQPRPGAQGLPAASYDLVCDGARRRPRATRSTSSARRTSPPTPWPTS